MALLYDVLLKPDQSRNNIRAGAYLSRVATVIAGIDGRPSIRLNINCEPVELSIDPAARLGLLLTELLTNAFKHAFEGRERGCISIEFSEVSDETVRLTDEDDGVGLPEGSEWPAGSSSIATQRRQALDAEGKLDTTSGVGTSGLGGSVVRGLTSQLDASLDVKSDSHGTCVTIDIDKAKVMAKR